MCGGRECVELFIVTHIDPNRESTFSLFFSLLTPSFAPSLLTLRGNHPFDDETHFMKTRTKRTWAVMSRYSHVRNSAALSFRISRTRASLCCKYVILIQLVRVSQRGFWDFIATNISFLASSLFDFAHNAKNTLCEYSPIKRDIWVPLSLLHYFKCWLLGRQITQ